MRPAPPSTAFGGPLGSSTEGTTGYDHMRLPSRISAHPSRAACPHEELHQRPKWRRSQASPISFL
eukprot:8498355-Pyramimonas_sp.AAC.1